MVQFGTGYYMPMDREYSQHETLHAREPSPRNSSTNDVGVGIGDIGISIGLGPTPNVPAIGAHMRSGTKAIELSFMGAGKGSGQGHTPEMYGRLQRQALREMQEANEVNFTTHASVGVYGLAGMDQQGNFSKQAKENSVHEIKRAIEFAADVGRGGPVVVHTGEFHRPIVDSEWNQKDDPYKGKFRMYEEEGERSSFRVVDSRTGGLIAEARKNKKVSRPVWNYAEEGQEFKDFDGALKKAASFEQRDGHKIAFDEKSRVIYLDPYGTRVSDEKRVPHFNKGTGQFDIVQMGWEDLENEAKQMTSRAKEVWQEWKNANPEQKKKIEEESYWKRFLKPGMNEKEIKIKPEEAYIISTLETNAANSRGWAYYYGGAFDEHVENIKKLRKAREFWKQIEDTAGDEKENLKREFNKRFGDLVPSETKYPHEIIDGLLRDEERQIKQSQEASASQWAQAEESTETIRNVISAENYALKESFDAYAQAGIKAMMQSAQLEKEKKLKEPIKVAMENLFPESYGAHPDELIHLVEGSRKRMAELLVSSKGMSPEQAQKEAAEHITATFDTGHLNMWRKYWQADPKKTMADNDKEFNKWMLSKVEQMAEKNIIGHLHLVDNFGYQDDHLSPGEGNVPMEEIVRKLKEKGFKGKIVVEPAADFTLDTSGHRGLTKAWKLFGSPVYGAAGGGGPRTWSDVGYGWFGQNQPPYFSFPPYTPSEDWTLWSGVQLE